MDIGPTELLVILVIVVILFGSGRIAKLGGELGQGMRDFRKGLSGEDEPPANKITPAAQTADTTTHNDPAAK